MVRACSSPVPPPRNAQTMALPVGFSLATKASDGGPTNGLICGLASESLGWNEEGVAGKSGSAVARYVSIALSIDGLMAFTKFPGAGPRETPPRI